MTAFLLRGKDLGGLIATFLMVPIKFFRVQHAIARVFHSIELYIFYY